MDKDAGLGVFPKGGIAIWHINTDFEDEGNKYYGRRLVDLEEADEFECKKSILDTGTSRRGDSLYYAKKVAGDHSAFNPLTTPSNSLESGDSNVPFWLMVQSPSENSMQVDISYRLNLGGASDISDGMYTIRGLNGYNMAMQEEGQGIYGFNSVSMGNSRVWFIRTQTNTDYSLLSPYAYPNAYLSYGDAPYLDTSSQIGDAQKWRFVKLGAKYFIQSYSGDVMLHVGSTLTATETMDTDGVAITRMNNPIFARLNKPQILYFSDVHKSAYLTLSDTSCPIIQKSNTLNAQLWYITISNDSLDYCYISPADRLNMVLEIQDDGTIQLTEKNSYSDRQKWSICEVNGNIEIRPKSDLTYALYMEPNTTSQCLSAKPKSVQNNQYFHWSYTQGTDVSEGGRFYFDYRLEGQVLDAENFGPAGAGIQKYAFNGAGNQRWRVVQVTDESCIILPEYNEQLALGVEKSANRVVLCSRNSSDDMIQWKIETRGRTCRIVPYQNSSSYLAVSGNTVCLAPVYSGVGYDWAAKDIVVEDRVNTLPEGAYRLRNAGSSLLLHGNGSINDHHIYQESEAYGRLNMQVWLIERTNDGYYCLRSAHDPKVCVTYDQALGRCTLVAYTGSDDQKWSALQETGATGFRFILKSMPGHALVVYGASTAPYADLTVFGDNGTDNGKWIPELTVPQRTLADQTCLLSNRNSELVMDAQNFSTEEGTRVLQWSKNYGTNQRWIIQWETDGYYRISPAYAPGMYLSAADDGKVRLTYHKDADNAKWLFLAESADGRNLRLTPKSQPGQVAVVQYASQNQGEEIILYEDNGSSNGYWSCIDSPMALTFSMYSIRNDRAGLYLGAASSTGPAQGVTLDQSYAFEIWAVHAGDGFYRFNPYKYGCTLKALSDGVTVSLGEEFPADPDAELWFVGADGRIHSKKYPGKVLALQNDGTAAGTPIVLVEEHTAQSEVWTFEALSSSRESQ